MQVVLGASPKKEKDGQRTNKQVKQSFLVRRRTGLLWPREDKKKKKRRLSANVAFPPLLGPSLHWPAPPENDQSLLRLFALSRWRCSLTSNFSLDCFQSPSSSSFITISFLTTWPARDSPLPPLALPSTFPSTTSSSSSFEFSICQVNTLFVWKIESLLSASINIHSPDTHTRNL